VSSRAVHQPGWVDLRGHDGKLLGRFDPTRDLLEIRHRGVSTIIDLAQYHAILQTGVTLQQEVNGHK
jgi:hypothetical protein